MPNWCDNSINISGPTKVIKQLEETNLKLSVLIPCPEELNDTTSGSIGANKKENKVFNQMMTNLSKKYGAKDWYEWNVVNWGTKWDIDVNDIFVESKRNKSTLQASFQSAWGPPLQAVKTLTKMHPELSVEFHYIETGCAFAGTYTYSPKNGEYHDEIQYSDSEELLAFARDNDNYLAEGEVEYIKEREEEEENEKSSEEK